MRFIDEAKITLQAGHGGAGAVSLHREKFITRGGPDGGDGGKGGDITFIASAQLGTLQDFRFKREYKAPRGGHGSGCNKAGRDGESIEIRVPVGTVIKDLNTGEILLDFISDGQEWLACAGGRGGKGNAHFATSTFQTPRFAQDGEEGERKELRLELKLLADAALVGFPNAGKSTFISKVSAAHPKIADYPFTTLTPCLGVVSVPEHPSFVLADIPGLIEGASQGIGLGHRFLKHIERTRVFIHLLDGSEILEAGEAANERLIQNYTVIREELRKFNEELLSFPEIVVINKSDLFSFDPSIIQTVRNSLRNHLIKVRGSLNHSGEPFIISSVTGEGISELLSVVEGFIQSERNLNMSENDRQTQLPDSEGLRAS